MKTDDGPSNIVGFPTQGGSGLPPGGRGPHDPNMEARVSILEAGFADLKASLGRIEAGQVVQGQELAAFRRDLKENDLPGIRTQLAGLDGKLQEKPSSKDFMALATSMIATLMKAFSLAVALVAVLVAAAWWLRQQGIF